MRYNVLSRRSSSATSRSPLVAISAIALTTILLAGCGANSETLAPPPGQSSPSTTVATITPPPANDGVPPGIVVATCTEPSNSGSSLTVSSYQPDGKQSDFRSTFKLRITGSVAPTPEVSCGDISSSPDIFPKNGIRHRDAFDAKFTRILATQRDATTQNQSIGWQDSVGGFIPLSPQATADDLLTKVDEYPMYHAATDRIYYWHTTKTASELMSCNPAGLEVKREDALQKSFDFEGLLAQGMGGLPGKARMYMPDTTAPILTNGRLANHAGTIGAVITPTPGLAFAPPTSLGKYDLATDGGLRFTGEVPQGTISRGLLLSTFVTDDTVIMQQDTQIYRVNTAGGKEAQTSLLFPNDKLKISDVTASPDGKTIAFLGRSETEVSLYTVPIAGGSPTKLAAFPKNAAILNFTQ